MSITISFSLSMESASILVKMASFQNKFGVFYTDTRTANYDKKSKAWHEIRVGSHFLNNIKPLLRMALLHIEYDDQRRAKSWEITKKGLLMAELLKLEVAETASLTLDSKEIKKLI